MDLMSTMFERKVGRIRVPTESTNESKRISPNMDRTPTEMSSVARAPTRSKQITSANNLFDKVLPSERKGKNERIVNNSQVPVKASVNGPGLSMPNNSALDSDPEEEEEMMDRNMPELLIDVAAQDVYGDLKNVELDLFGDISISASEIDDSSDSKTRDNDVQRTVEDTSTGENVTDKQKICPVKESYVQHEDMKKTEIDLFGVMSSSDSESDYDEPDSATKGNDVQKTVDDTSTCQTVPDKLDSSTITEVYPTIEGAEKLDSIDPTTMTRVSDAVIENTRTKLSYSSSSDSESDDRLTIDFKVPVESNTPRRSIFDLSDEEDTMSQVGEKSTVVMTNEAPTQQNSEQCPPESLLTGNSLSDGKNYLPDKSTFHLSSDEEAAKTGVTNENKTEIQQQSIEEFVQKNILNCKFNAENESENPVCSSDIVPDLMDTTLHEDDAKSNMISMPTVTDQDEQNNMIDKKNEVVLPNSNNEEDKRICVGIIPTQIAQTEKTHVTGAAKKDNNSESTLTKESVIAMNQNPMDEKEEGMLSDSESDEDDESISVATADHHVKSGTWNHDNSIPTTTNNARQKISIDSNNRGNMAYEDMMQRAPTITKTQVHRKKFSYISSSSESEEDYKRMYKGPVRSKTKHTDGDKRKFRSEKQGSSKSYAGKPINFKIENGDVEKSIGDGEIKRQYVRNHGDIEKRRYGYGIAEKEFGEGINNNAKEISQKRTNKYQYGAKSEQIVQKSGSVKTSIQSCDNNQRKYDDNNNKTTSKWKHEKEVISTNALKEYEKPLSPNLPRKKEFHEETRKCSSKQIGVPQKKYCSKQITHNQADEKSQNIETAPNFMDNLDKDIETTKMEIKRLEGVLDSLMQVKRKRCHDEEENAPKSEKRQKLLKQKESFEQMRKFLNDMKLKEEREVRSLFSLQNLQMLKKNIP